MHCLIYRLRKKNAVLKINVKQKTIYFDYLKPETVEINQIKRLCKEFGFNRQAMII